MQKSEQHEQAIAFLRDQLTLSRSDRRLYELLASQL